jgi:hypothetical protein
VFALEDVRDDEVVGVYEGEPERLWRAGVADTKAVKTPEGYTTLTSKLSTPPANRSASVSSGSS